MRHILRLPALCGGGQNGSNQLYQFRMFDLELAPIEKETHL